MIDENPKYDSVTVACYIAAMANGRKIGMNMTKLQKLLYIAYGTYLAVEERRLTNEHPQAWPYGPVFPAARNRLLKKDLSLVTLDSPEVRKIKDDGEMKSLVSLVLDGFGGKNATTLAVWSHQSGSPWDRAASREGFSWGGRIPDEFIYEYFKSILVRNGG